MLSRPEYFPWYHISLFMNSSGRQALRRTAFNQDNKKNLLIEPYFIVSSLSLKLFTIFLQKQLLPNSLGCFN